jgi:hypothetical protein
MESSSREILELLSTLSTRLLRCDRDIQNSDHLMLENLPCSNGRAILETLSTDLATLILIRRHPLQGDGVVIAKVHISSIGQAILEQLSTLPQSSCG